MASSLHSFKRNRPNEDSEMLNLLKEIHSGVLKQFYSPQELRWRKILNWNYGQRQILKENNLDFELKEDNIVGSWHKFDMNLPKCGVFRDWHICEVLCIVIELSIGVTFKSQLILILH